MTKLAILSPTEKKQFDAPPRFTKEERHRYFTIPASMRTVVSRIARADNKVGFVLLLGYFRATARFFSAEKFRQRDINYVRRMLRHSDVDLDNYSGTIVMRHRRRILSHLDWQEPEGPFKEQLTSLASQYACQQESPKQIFYALINACWKNQIAIPSYRELSEIITHSYNDSEQRLLEQVEQALTAEQSKRLEIMLTPLRRSSRATLAITEYKTIDQSLRPKTIT